MSKMDDLRAMREARYEQMTKRASGPTAAPRAVAPRTAAPRKRAEAPPVADEVKPSEETLCGHRAISGRTCTREQGHAAKSHRYA